MLSCCRHFGGTKLGTGGLARAYGGAARDCLRSAEKVTFQRQATLCMQVKIHFNLSICMSTGWFEAICIEVGKLSTVGQCYVTLEPSRRVMHVLGDR